jgi:hypothetical protein
LVFGVLRALRKGRGGGWAHVGGTCTSVTATLQCDGHHSRVSVPCLEVQTPIRKRGRCYREGKARRHDTRAHGQERGGGCNTTCFTVRRSLFFSSRIGCDLHDRRRLRTCCWRQRKGKEEEPKTKQLSGWTKNN